MKVFWVGSKHRCKDLDLSQTQNTQREVQTNFRRILVGTDQLS